MTNQDLATAAIDIANQAPAGSMDRRAAGCAAVVLGSTRTVAGARKALAKARLDRAVRAATEQLINRLAAEATEGGHDAPHLADA